MKYSRELYTRNILNYHVNSYSRTFRTIDRIDYIFVSFYEYLSLFTIFTTAFKIRKKICLPNREKKIIISKFPVEEQEQWRKRFEYCKRPLKYRYKVLKKKSGIDSSMLKGCSVVIGTTGTSCLILL